MKKLYDVYFKIDGEAVMCIEANSEEEAEDYIQTKVDKSTLLERLSNALEFHGITCEAERISN